MIAAHVLANLPRAFEDPTLRYRVIHKLTVVANQHHGSLITVDKLFQQLQGFDIQIVCRFIEYQQVTGLEEQARQQQAVTLPARQCPHRRHRAFRMEHKVLQIAQDVARLAVHHHFLFTFREVVHHRFIRIKFRAVLVEVSHFQLGTHMNTSTIRLQLTEHQLQQRSFAAAVRANQRNFVAALDLSGEVFNQHLAINLVVDVLHFEHNLARTRGLFHLHLRAAHHFTALTALAAHGFQRPHAPFVTGATRFDPLTDPHFFLRQLAIELRVL